MAILLRLSKISIVSALVAMFTACAAGGGFSHPNLNAKDPNVETYLGVNYKTDIPQSFNYILYSRNGTFDQSLRFTNTGTLFFNEDALEYANNTDDVIIPYDSIISVKRLIVPVGRPKSAVRRDTWLAIRFQDGDKLRRVGFRGDLARAHPWTGDRLVGLLRTTLASRGDAQ